VTPGNRASGPCGSGFRARKTGQPLEGAHRFRAKKVWSDALAVYAPWRGLPPWFGQPSQPLDSFPERLAAGLVVAEHFEAPLPSPATRPSLACSKARLFFGAVCPQRTTLRTFPLLTTISARPWKGIFLP
jgi:hypothetical protein